MSCLEAALRDPFLACAEGEDEGAKRGAFAGFHDFPKVRDDGDEGLVAFGVCDHEAVVDFGRVLDFQVEFEHVVDHLEAVDVLARGDAFEAFGVGLGGGARGEVFALAHVPEDEAGEVGAFAEEEGLH